MVNTTRAKWGKHAQLASPLVRSDRSHEKGASLQKLLRPNVLGSKNEYNSFHSCRSCGHYHQSGVLAHPAVLQCHNCLGEERAARPCLGGRCRGKLPHHFKSLDPSVMTSANTGRVAGSLVVKHTVDVDPRLLAESMLTLCQFEHKLFVRTGGD
eukprot:5800537-Amphidinium_carterae.1